MCSPRTDGRFAVHTRSGCFIRSCVSLAQLEPMYGICWYLGVFCLPCLLIVCAILFKSILRHNYLHELYRCASSVVYEQYNSESGAVWRPECGSSAFWCTLVRLASLHYIWCYRFELLYIRVCGVCIYIYSIYVTWHLCYTYTINTHTHSSVYIIYTPPAKRTMTTTPYLCGVHTVDGRFLCGCGGWRKWCR